MGNTPWFMWVFWGCLALLGPLYGLWYWRLLTELQRVLARHVESSDDLKVALRSIRRRYSLVLVGLNWLALLVVLAFLVAIGESLNQIVIWGLILGVACILGGLFQTSFWIGLASTSAANRTKVSS